MEIHSSSLAFFPAGNNATNHNDNPRLSNDKKERNEKSLILIPAKMVGSSLIENKVKQLSDEIDHQNRPSNSRTTRALDAYIQQNTQPLKNQRSELVSGIDLFA